MEVHICLRSEYQYAEAIDTSFTLIDPYKGLPEWEKRRRQSRDAKADLIKRMKK